MLTETLDRAMDLLERYVASQEEIARALAATAKSRPMAELLEPALEQVEAEVVETIPEQPRLFAPQIPEVNGVRDQRQWLKDRLAELGVPFTQKTATTTLQKKYEAEVERLQEIPSATMETAAAIVQEEASAPVSKEEVTRHLMDFAEKHGGDAARVVLAQFGAKSLSAVDPGDYADFITALNDHAAGKEG